MVLVTYGWNPKMQVEAMAAMNPATRIFIARCLRFMPKAMKKAVGTLRLDLAQYREMEVFTQFSSDLDEETKSQLAYGQSLMYILRQGRSAGLSQGEQVVALVTAMAHLYQQVPVAQVCALRDFLLGEFAAQRQSLMLQLEQGAAPENELRGQINDFARTALEKFKRTGGR